MADAGLEGWTVTRHVTVPRSVSEPAQRALAAGGARLEQAAATTPPAPNDKDAWRAHIAFLDSMLVGMYQPQADAVGATVDETVVDGVPVFAITPPGADPEQGPVYLDVHGGALIMGGGPCCRAMGTIAAGRAGIHTWAVDYRMPPDHPYPAGLDDCVAVYRALLATRAPKQIVVGGASAGGNLAAALLLRARDEGLPMPAGCVLISPEVDLTESGDSFTANLGLDTALPKSLAPSIALYAAGADLASPYLSPLFGDLAGFPPTFVQTGTRDLFLSNGVRMHRSLRAAGVPAELHVFEAMPHGGFGGAPEDAELARELRAFVSNVLG